MIAWALVPFILAALVFLARRRNRVRVELIRQRTPEHQALLELLADWLNEESIQEVLVRTGTVTLDRLEKLEDAASGMEEHQLVILVATLTRDRHVRQVIARHLMRKWPDLEQRHAMRMVLAFHEGGSGKLLEREGPAPPMDYWR